MNCKQTTEKRLEGSTSETVNDTMNSLEKAVSPVCRIQIKVRAPVVASGATNLKNYTEWLNTIESEVKSTRAIKSGAAVFLSSVLNIPQKVTSTTRRAFQVKSDGISFKARQVVLGWRQKHRIDCSTTLFFQFI